MHRGDRAHNGTVHCFRGDMRVPMALILLSSFSSVYMYPQIHLSIEISAPLSRAAWSVLSLKEVGIQLTVCLLTLPAC